MDKKLLTHIVVAIVAIVLSVYLFTSAQNNATFRGATYNSDPTFANASSTTFTLTTASQQLLASTSRPIRTAATIQPVNCTLSQPIYVALNRGAAAVAGQGVTVFASTTLALGAYPNVPVVQGGVTGITAVGTCTVTVTEWRTQY